MKFQALINEYGSFDFFAKTKITTYAEMWNRLLCQETSPAMGLCAASITMLCGQNKNHTEIDVRILPDYLKNMAHAVSIKQFTHFIQLVASGSFRQYDYHGKNRQIYNAPFPPDYKLDNIIAPVYLYSGGSDAIISERDIEHLKEALQNVQKYRSIKNFNHCDFNYGLNTRFILFNDILKAMNNEISG